MDGEMDPSDHDDGATANLAGHPTTQLTQAARDLTNAAAVTAQVSGHRGRSNRSCLAHHASLAVEVILRDLNISATRDFFGTETMTVASAPATSAPRFAVDTSMTDRAGLRADHVVLP